MSSPTTAAPCTAPASRMSLISLPMSCGVFSTLLLASTFPVSATLISAQWISLATSTPTARDMRCLPSAVLSLACSLFPPSSPYIAIIRRSA